MTPDLDDVDTAIVLALVGGARTVRECSGAARRSVDVTHKRLVRLRRAGLVRWEDGNAGTLRATVVPVACG